MRAEGKSLRGRSGTETQPTEAYKINDRESVSRYALAKYFEEKSKLGGELEEERIKPAEYQKLVKERLFETLLISGSKKINEGRDSYILELDFRILPEELTEEIADFFPDLLSGESVVKFLKIFKVGSAENEIANQERARELVLESGHEDEVVIPQVKNADFNSVMLDHPELFTANTGIRALDSVSFILMDKVDGVDIATLAVQEAVKDLISERLKDEEDDADIEIIHQLIDYKILHCSNFTKLEHDAALKQQALALAKSLRSSIKGTSFKTIDWVKSLSDSEQKLLEDVFDLHDEFLALSRLQEDRGAGKKEQKKIINDYIGSLTNYNLLEGALLNLSGLGSVKDFSDQKRMLVDLMKKSLAGKGLVRGNGATVLRDVLTKMHIARFYHRDLHPRNIMIGRDGRIYLIDYAKSKRDGSPDNEQSNYIAEGEICVDDFESTNPGSFLDYISRKE